MEIADTRQAEQEEAWRASESGTMVPGPGGPVSMLELFRAVGEAFAASSIPVNLRQPVWVPAFGSLRSSGWKPGDEVELVSSSGAALG